jgi:hypothetical protein
MVGRKFRHNSLFSLWAAYRPDTQRAIEEFSALRAARQQEHHRAFNSV